MTKEEMLDNGPYGFESNQRKSVLSTMEEYAKQEAIAFSEFIIESKFKPFLENMWSRKKENKQHEVLKSNQLYSLYLQSKEK